MIRVPTTFQLDSYYKDWIRQKEDMDRLHRQADDLREQAKEVQGQASELLEMAAKLDQEAESYKPGLESILKAHNYLHRMQIINHNCSLTGALNLKSWLHNDRGYLINPLIYVVDIMAYNKIATTFEGLDYYWLRVYEYADWKNLEPKEGATTLDLVKNDFKTLIAEGYVKMIEHNSDWLKVAITQKARNLFKDEVFEEVRS